MNRYKKQVKPITAAGLKEFEGWEIRRVYGESPAAVLQNPDSGEKVRVLVDAECFKSGYVRVERRKVVE